ncbi:MULTISPECIES: hypothetical protein [unclassified Rhodococcus (in: high G+C Gram-positive bacteria)]|uniref:hypothetical protein n=1 Tax=unclassified Rhodococcus (in: high G+C Gram-positive bacteria) TaxID=192944 RepID=UPI0015C5F825|nr:MULTISPECIES: hypothetical protein [unclassified Rhodococcus (in: high G+C Gram-positive bacteria)]
MSALVESFVRAFTEAAEKIPLACSVCGKVVAHVHPPAPSVALTCSKCREVTP